MKIARLLCFVGWHKWERGPVHNFPYWEKGHFYRQVSRTCMRCPTYKVTRRTLR